MKTHIIDSRNCIQAEALERIIFHVVIVRLQEENFWGLRQVCKPPGSSFVSFFGAIMRELVTYIFQVVNWVMAVFLICFPLALFHVDPPTFNKV